MKYRGEKARKLTINADQLCLLMYFKDSTSAKKQLASPGKANEAHLLKLQKPLVSSENPTQL